MANIRETLYLAHYNLFDNTHPYAFLVGKQQLTRAVALLYKGYDLDSDDVDELIQKHELLMNVPMKKSNTEEQK